MSGHDNHSSIGKHIAQNSKSGGASVKLKYGSRLTLETKDSLKGEEDHA
jgi:hypothetical protein